MLGKIAADFLQSAFDIQIVGIQPADNVAGGAGQTHIDSVGLAAIRLALPIGKPFRTGANDVCAAIL